MLSPTAWPSSPSRAGLLVDFDGTLAPIVAAPDEARPLPGAAAVLGRLAGRLALVAVVSGRPVAFLAEQLAAAGAAQLVGLYGLERIGAGGRRDRNPAAARWESVVDAVAAAGEAAVPAGGRVERKGLAVTVHYRQAPQLAAWAETFARQQAGATGLVAHSGKMSWELRPPGPTDKGTVVAELAGGLASVCFIGDDTGDLPAFAALARLRGRGVETLAVAVAGAETPEEVLAAADVVLDGPPAVLGFLEELDRREPADPD